MKEQLLTDPLTPSETETLKMFEETYDTYDIGVCSEQLVSRSAHRKSIKDFLLTQLRLARADERKQAYEDALKQVWCREDIDGGMCDCCNANHDRIDDLNVAHKA